MLFIGSSSPGLPCPPGYYCIGPNGGLSDSNAPDPCPEGTFTSEEGSRCRLKLIIVLQIAQ